MGNALVQQIVAGIASGLGLILVGSILRFAKSVRDNSEAVKELSKALKKHIQNHPH